MDRKQFIKNALGGALAVSLSGSALAGALKQGEHKMKKKETYFHYLLFWLDPSLSAEKVKEFENFFIGLSHLPYQKHLRYGVPANSSPRAVLDNSFSYNCTMEFDTLEELEAYGKLPEHLALVAKYKPYFVKMMVHDTKF